MGLFRAPKDRQQLSSYWWFCLEHVRAYNASWDFYRGMSAEQIEAEVRRDTTWQRPTWRFGQMPGRTASRRFRDPFHVMGEGEGEAPPRSRPGAYSPEQQAALAVFDLDAPVPLADIKQRYKTLVKRHHPDANGGSKEAEERLKVINAAYRTLRTQASPGP
ncbi:MAG: J domain-containing protein [Alphaproteobacteria bacterium]|nr:J domain-containing protein [Alphaproteobacteria bacterium]